MRYHSPSFSDKIGGISFSPNIPPKKNSENFSISTILPRWLFSVFLVRKIMTLSKWLFSIFLVRKIMGMKDLCRYPNRGGYPSFIPALCPLSLLPLWSPLYLSSIHKARIWIYFGKSWCFIGKIGYSEERKPNKYLVVVWYYALWVPFLCCFCRSYPTVLVGALCSQSSIMAKTDKNKLF